MCDASDNKRSILRDTFIVLQNGTLKESYKKSWAMPLTASTSDWREPAEEELRALSNCSEYIDAERAFVEKVIANTCRLCAQICVNYPEGFDRQIIDPPTWWLRVHNPGPRFIVAS